MNAYTIRTIPLAEGDIATLIHASARDNAQGAVMYIHGFADYFFQDHVADHFTERGYDFYAVDLRRYGRSIREGEVPYFITDLTTYYEELDAAVRRIHADGHARVVVLAHSTGGLIASLWLHDRRTDLEIDALVLNSPWLDLQKPWFERTIATWAVDLVVGRLRPMLVLPERLSDVYPKSIHRDAHGEWEFNTDWKPLARVPIYAGWFRAIRRGHSRIHKGLDVRCPVLLMRSDTSRLELDAWKPEAMTADTVLDVAQMETWAPALGQNVKTIAIPDGMHDLFLSPQPVRDRAFAEMDAWLDSTPA